MRIWLRCISEYREFWRVWLPLVLLAVLQPLLGMMMPLVEKQLIDTVLLPRRLDLLPRTVTLYGLLWVSMIGSGIAGAILRTYLGEQLMLRLRKRLFLHCEKLALAFAHREHSGRTMALFVSDAPNLAGLFSTAIIGGLSSFVAIVVGGALMFRLSWQLALVAGLLPPLALGLAAMVTRPLRPASRRVQEKAADLSERLQENFMGMREIIAFGLGRFQERRFTATMRELVRLRLRVTIIDTAFGTGQSLFSLLVTVVMLGFGGFLVIRGHITLGTLVAIRSLFSRVFQPAGQLFGILSTVQKSLASADRIYAFLDQQPRVQERPRALIPACIAGEVSVEHVSFSYDEKHPVLSEVSFVARSGELIALVGPSGAGKSTLAGLIARFYDPTAGRILLDGVDLRDLSLDALHRAIGLVFQDTFLFATTIRENIAFGRAGAAEAEIVAAARAAHAWEFIELLPEGLDTLVGERGVRLSEGQKQRIAIARALLRDPRILILDEPTSALDARSEQVLQAALDNLTRGRTTFVIAHRLATVRRADRILALDDGRIVEQGAHAELLAQRGLYRELFELQFGGVTSQAVATEEPIVAYGG